MVRLVSLGAFFALVLTLGACGNAESESAAPSGSVASASDASSRPSGNGACGLMMQAEVDELFGTGVGAGVDETLDWEVELCSWPSGDEPSLLLQISLGTSDVRAAVDLGDGYRVVEIPEMSGPAAAAIENANANANADQPEAVIVFALAAGDRMVTVSPIGLGIAAGSPQFDALKALMDRIASRI